MGSPYAYLRKSRVLRDKEVVSPEMQLAAAQEYARLFGDEHLVVLTDLNKSGRKGRRERPGFDALLTAIEAGAVSAIYSYSLSRLSRSVRDIMALADLCREHGVPIRLARDTDPDPTTATGRAVLALLGVMAQLEADLASERALDAVEARRARGDKFGGPVCEEPGPVLAAFDEAGSLTGAARLLNQRGVPTARGKGTWYPSAVRAVVRREARDRLPTGQPRGVKASAPFVFYRLLRCHCGTTMTGTRRRDRWATYTGYRCSRGHLQTGHGQTYVSEKRVMEWAVREAAKLRLPKEPVAIAEASEAEREVLVEKLDRIRVAWVAGLYHDEAEMLAEKAEVDEAITQLDLRGRALMVPPVDWRNEPAVVNRTLRTLWEYVLLDEGLRPRRAERLLPPSWWSD